MIFHFVDRNENIIEALRSHFIDLECQGTVKLTVGDLGEYLLTHNTYVSASNSFGVIDGGSDRVYLDAFGNGLQEKIRHTIATEFYGELPVGNACLVDIDSIRKIVCAPTMRVPQLIGSTSNAYLAFRAVVLECLKRKLSGPILCPGFGTGVGRMDPNIAASQMREAYDQAQEHFKTNKEAMTLGEAARHELMLRTL